MSSNLLRKGVLIVPLLIIGCSSAPKEEAPAPETVPMRQSSGNSSGLAIGHDSGEAGDRGVAAPTMGAGNSDQPLTWTPPANWKAGPEKPMRAATYLISPTSGDSDGAECAVFLNIGGGVQANLERWIGQFSQPDGGPSTRQAKQRRETINGFPVSFVELNGTFNAGGMGMGGPTTPKPGYRLLGAIVESPGGEVFFKLTGPEKTVNAAAKDFQSLIRSIR